MSYCIRFCSSQVFDTSFHYRTPFKKILVVGLRPEGRYSITHTSGKFYVYNMEKVYFVESKIKSRICLMVPPGCFCRFYTYVPKYVRTTCLC